MIHHLRYLNPLTELGLPAPRISAHARRQKSIRDGYVSRLHVWWARRLLTACRAIICASLWPDPEDTNIAVEARFIEVEGRVVVGELSLA